MDTGSVLCGLVIAVIVFLGVLLLLVNARWEGKWLQEIKALAARHGWSFQMHPRNGVDAIVAGNEDGVPWTLTYSRPKRQTSTQWTGEEGAAWRTEQAALPNGVVLVMPPIANIPPQMRADPTGANTMLLQFFLGKMGIDTSGMNLVNVGTPAFQSRYMVFSQFEESARALVEGTEGQLLSWPQQNRTLIPTIVVDSKGVMVSVHRDLGLLKAFGEERLDYERQLPERLIRLGVTAVDALRHAG